MIWLIGALSNRMRGGLYKEYRPWLGGDPLNSAIFALTVLYLTHSPLTAGFSFAMMWLGGAPGWNKYIGTMGRWEDPSPCVWFIDWIIRPLQRWPFWWGFSGMTLRGLFWGACIAIALQSYLPLIGGALMGVVYFISLTDGKRDYGWPLAEWLFGGLFWSISLAEAGV